MGKPSSGFLLLLADLEECRRVPVLPSAREDHQRDLEGQEDPDTITYDPDTISIDLAPLLGLESAPHRVLTFANLSAVQLFRMAESKARLEQERRIEGWPGHVCHDLALFAAMHRAPSQEGSGKSLLDLYAPFVERPALRNVYLYLLERVGRAWPSLVRSELAMEIFYQDQRYAQFLLMQAAAEAGRELPEALKEPTPEVREADAEAQGLMPSEEVHPNGFAL